MNEDQAEQERARELYGFLHWFIAGLSAISLALFTFVMSRGDISQLEKLAAGCFLFSILPLAVASLILRSPQYPQRKTKHSELAWSQLGTLGALFLIVGFWILCGALGGVLFFGVFLMSCLVCLPTLSKALESMKASHSTATKEKTHLEEQPNE